MSTALIWLGIAITGYKYVSSPLGHGAGWWISCVLLLFVAITRLFWREA